MAELGPLVKETEKETGLLEQREYRQDFALEDQGL